ncbi:hypothetical protein QVD17_18681 [Tagetes erecta]|uniref:Dof zinc finger protein n=1 Tax=Tagetes erecta TaxID=13708 RepID=A0AAD8NWM4_TARER|nr:hypothetical protein QVD17_18681 [Tagetes erecta]
MPTQTTDHRRTPTVKTHHAAVTPPPHEPEHLPCPRCDSTNTKFCYYNNYNFSQPRHFCKACRRYWTQGGTLRDIPVGGGSRKNTKRLRVSTDATARNYSPASILPSSTVTTASMLGSGHGGSFTSLLSNAHGPGLFGPGPGSGPGHEVCGYDQEVGFGFGRMIWPFGGGGGGWQLENGGGECYVLPDLAISTPGSGMKIE